MLLLKMKNNCESGRGRDIKWIFRISVRCALLQGISESKKSCKLKDLRMNLNAKEKNFLEEGKIIFQRFPLIKSFSSHE